jgi:hypothetical protein
MKIGGSPRREVILVAAVVQRDVANQRAQRPRVMPVIEGCSHEFPPQR